MITRRSTFVHLIVSALAIGCALAQDALLRSGDMLELRLGGVPPEEVQQVSGPYTIDGDGFINLPHIGKIRADQTTQSELQRAIEASYKSQQIYTNPSITLTIPNTARFVNTGGEVKAPQRVPFTADLTLLGAISASGGFTEFADQKKVRLLRDGKVTIVNVKDVRKDPEKDVRLKPGDRIEVPQSFW
ncbi:MAG: polysaccharide biosynthesis/export family protein [bacterium]